MRKEEKLVRGNDRHKRQGESLDYGLFDGSHRDRVVMEVK
jgi:hypothetical protein